MANTHILFNPRRGEIKLAQVKLLFSEVERLKEKYKHRCYFIINGDFNSTPPSPLYYFIMNGHLNSSSFRYDGSLISGQGEKRPKVNASFHKTAGMYM